MKTFNKMALVCALLTIFFNVSARTTAYCVPLITKGGAFFNAVDFNTGLPDALSYLNSGSQGYADHSAVSSGIVYKGCVPTIFFSVNSCGNRGIVRFNLRVFADWNNDGNFDTDSEVAIDLNAKLKDGDCSLYNIGLVMSMPANLKAGSIHIRCAIREGGEKATPCGGYTGEIEDYTLTIADIAPAALNIFAKNDYVYIDWKADRERSGQAYKIEKCTDGVNFTEAFDATGDGSDHYEWIDKDVSEGNNFYRLNMLSCTGEQQTGKTIKIVMPKSTGKITISPTMVFDKILTVNFRFLPKGDYKINIFNLLGQRVFQKTIFHPGNNSSQLIILPNAITTGMYKLVTNSLNRNYTTTLFIN